MPTVPGSTNGDEPKSKRVLSEVDVDFWFKVLKGVVILALGLAGFKINHEVQVAARATQENSAKLGQIQTQLASGGFGSLPSANRPALLAPPAQAPAPVPTPSKK